MIIVQMRMVLASEVPQNENTNYTYKKQTILFLKIAGNMIKST